MAPDPDPVGPPDRQTLRLLEKHLADDPIVAGTAYEPDVHAPRLLRAHLDATRYPAAVTDARLDVRWFSSGDVSVHYLEVGADGPRWECRWDRHPNDHDPRLHFHRPPDGADVSDLSLPSLHPLEVYSTVLAAIERRIESHWSDQG